MMELLYAVERAMELLKNQHILGEAVRVPVARRGGEGIGVVEAPRGTLIHHYVADDDSRIVRVNLVVSTAQNKIAMDRSMRDVAESVVADGAIKEEKLNRFEMAIRCYDPCLSCSTHSFGKMPLEVVLRDPAGETVARAWHGSSTE